MQCLWAATRSSETAGRVTAWKWTKRRIAAELGGDRVPATGRARCDALKHLARSAFSRSEAPGEPARLADGCARACVGEQPGRAHPGYRPARLRGTLRRCAVRPGTQGPAGAPSALERARARRRGVMDCFLRSRRARARQPFSLKRSLRCRRWCGIRSGAARRPAGVPVGSCTSRGGLYGGRQTAGNGGATSGKPTSRRCARSSGGGLTRRGRCGSRGPLRPPSFAP